MATEHPEKVVRITMKDGMPIPDQDPIVLKKGTQRLRFAADFDFRITIEDYNDVNYANGGKEFHCRTGKFDRERSHKYTISANGVDNDPSIDVKP